MVKDIIMGDAAAQFIFNVLLTLTATLGGWVLRSIHEAVKDLQKNDQALAEKIQSIELLVAGNYVQRSDMQHAMDALFNKLDRIENKLDRKADK